MQEQNKLSKTARSDQIFRGVSVLCARMIFLVALLCLVSEPAVAWGPKRCTQTSWAAFVACQNEARDDYWIAAGNCYNLSDREARAECFKDALSERREAVEECNAQRQARLEVCEDVGEAPYDPEIDPDDFVDPTTITDANANLYFPLVPGYHWIYGGETDEGTETITVTVTGETKEIEYPPESGKIFQCAVVHDVVYLNGEVIEDTDDWYAQDEFGNVWYFGETSQELEEGELVSIDGSWKAGVDYAKPGIIMFANPQAHVEQVYRQEFALGEAEDIGKVKSFGGSVEVLGETYLSHVVIEDTTPLEPDTSEDKFFAEGLGLYKEVNNETGEIVELISFTP